MKIDWHVDTLKLNRYAEIRVKCKYCGHTNTMPVFVEERLCSWCKNKIRNKGKAYFKYKVRKIINNGD